MASTKDIAHTRIRSLKCFDQMCALRQTGVNDEEVARFIHAQGEMTNIQVRSVAQAVRRFFDDNPELAVTKDPALARAIDLAHGGEPPKYITRLREKVEDHIDALTEMESLYEIQKERVLEYREKERKGEKVEATTRAEIKVALNMLGNIAKLQMDLQIVERAPARLDARVAQWKQIDVGTELLKLIAEKPEMAKLLESPEALKDLIRGELIED